MSVFSHTVQEEIIKRCMTQAPIDDRVLQVLSTDGAEPQVIAECAFTWLQVNE